MSKKNATGGKNFKKSKRQTINSRELIFKEDGQEYALVTKELGGFRMSLECFDNLARTGLVRGALRGRVFIKPGDIVLIGLRGDMESNKADILHKYTSDESRTLVARGELPSTAKINSTKTDLESSLYNNNPENDLLNLDFI